MKTIAVTGSSGFIGKHLVKALKDLKFTVIELDIDKNINLLDSKQVSEILPFDTIIHLAAKSYVPDSFIKPFEFYYTNYALTLNILELARKYSANVIFFSSYLYGTPEYLPINESHPLKPHNPYAQSKLICEKLCDGYNRDFQVPIVIFRPFNIYGPGQNCSFLIPSIVNQLAKSEIVLKDPRPKRDFVYISDVIQAILCAIDYKSSAIETFNIGTGKSYSISELVSMISSIIGSATNIIYTNEYRKGEVLDTVADISRICSVFNWAPKIELNQGLHELLILNNALQ